MMPSMDWPEFIPRRITNTRMRVAGCLARLLNSPRPAYTCLIDGSIREHVE